MTKILQKLIEHSTGLQLSHFFLDLFEAAKLDAGCTPRFLGSHPGGALLLSQLIQTRAQFVVEIPIDARAREKIASKTR